MSKIVTLSFLLAKSLYREKASYLFAVIAGMIMFIALGLSGTNIGAKYKLFEDILLTSQGYLFIIAALFYAFSQVSRDRNLGVFVLPLANGVKRYEYLLAQMLSLGWILSVIFLMFCLLDLVAVFMVEGSIHVLLLWQLFLYFLTGVLVAFWVVTLSLYVSITNAALYAIVLFLIGNALDELYLYARFVTNDTLLQQLAPVLYYLLPNFSLFDQQERVVNYYNINVWEGFLLPLVYFVIWSMILFLSSLVRFQKKALTVGN